MLEFDQYIPPDIQDGAPLIVLLHGRGSNKADLMGLQPHLPPQAMIITPQAPFSSREWGYGNGWAWYRFLGGNTPEPESFEAGQQQLDVFLQDLPRHLPVRHGLLVLGGFSQGAVSSMGYALRNPGKIPAILNFSGYIPNHPSVHVTPDTVDHTRFFWGHGIHDQMIAFNYAREGQALLQKAGAIVESHDYRTGHWIDPNELQDARKWLDTLLKP